MTHVEIRPGVRLYVEDFGDGHPLLFVHGGGVTHGFWQHQAAGLTGVARTITYDHRGCGESDKTGERYSVDGWADDLRELIERLRLDAPTVIGHGLGAHIAIRLAARHPGTAGRLVLTSAAPWFMGTRDADGEGGFTDELWQRMQRGWTTDRPQFELDLIDGSYFLRPPSEGIRLACLQMALTWAVPVYLDLAKTLPEIDHRDVLGSLTLPVLVIHGRHDRKNRYEGGKLLAELLPHATLVTLEDSAHCPPIEEPHRYNALLAEHLLAAPV